jgi:hypothetical protein
MLGPFTGASCRVPLVSNGVVEQSDKGVLSWTLGQVRPSGVKKTHVLPLLSGFDTLGLYDKVQLWVGNSLVWEAASSGELHQTFRPGGVDWPLHLITAYQDVALVFTRSEEDSLLPLFAFVWQDGAVPVGGDLEAGTAGAVTVLPCPDFADAGSMCVPGLRFCFGVSRPVAPVEAPLAEEPQAEVAVHDPPIAVLVHQC